MSAYSDAYSRLNDRQREAVDYIDGPLLVLAGPGTGKTQLLSTRAARIVEMGSASPANILCLTYTDAGSTEMRLRLAKIMGTAGGDIAVHTFHSFGSWLIEAYPELFNAERSLKAIDELTRYRILETILSKLPLLHSLAVRDENNRFLKQGSVQAAIEAMKKAGHTPSNMRTILSENRRDYELLQPLLTEIFATTLGAKRLPDIKSNVEAAYQQFENGSYGELLLQGMLTAIGDSIEIGKTKPLGDWRTAHMQIVNGTKVLKSMARHQALLDVIDVYELYQQALTNEARFDYDDMVLWAVNALQQNDDLRLEIAERFQYIMVDEYQDTNGVQNELLDAILSANPLDAPNIMVVGDDDQAIMRFQGAELSGLLGFIHAYQPEIVTLTDNYRSGQAVLNASRNVMLQTTERLESALPSLGLSKALMAQNEPKTVSLQHRSFVTEAAQMQAVATMVKRLIDDQVDAADIAIIGRKHKDLIAVVPFLETSGIVVNYDYRENILHDKRIVELLELAEYLVAFSSQPDRADALLPTILAAEYWQLPAIDVYKLAAKAKELKESWLNTMLQSDEAWQQRANWLVSAAAVIGKENFTTGLDIIIGRTPLATSDLTAPFARYFDVSEHERYVRLISHLIRLRTAVLESRPTATSLADMLDVVHEYRRSAIKLNDNNPLLRGDQSGVTLLSAHGAKGREFKHVVILSAVDNVWGNRARGHNQRIYLPENLPLYPAGDTESDRIRLLYVAMTRAKSHLTLVSYDQTDDGKSVIPLTYVLGDETWTPKPGKLSEESTKKALETLWQPAANSDGRSLQSIVTPLLPYFRLSPTALRQFLDICYSGPHVFFERSVLGFPSAYTASTALGQAVHSVLEQAQRAYAADEPLSTGAALRLFNTGLDNSGLPEDELFAARSHGEQFLPDFLRRFSVSDFPYITSTEQYVSTEINGIPFGGKIDAIKESLEGLVVIDYKTGKPPLPDWQTKGLPEGKKISLHFNRQQLLTYKLLLENAGKRVTGAELVFVEPSEITEDTVRLRINDFSAEELDMTARLITKVYKCLELGELPDVSQYSKDLQGIQQFESDLLAS